MSEATKDGKELAGTSGSAFRHGQKCVIRRLSDVVPLQCQGGGRPRIGDIVKIGAYPDAVQKCAHVTGGYLYWVIGQNESGEYGAQFIGPDLAEIDPDLGPIEE